jgi:hypothetical protein
VLIAPAPLPRERCGRREHAALLLNLPRRLPALQPSPQPKQVTNSTGAALKGLQVVLDGAGEVAKSWNCTDAGALPGGLYAFGLPDWCRKSGLAPGSGFTMGVIVKGTQPGAFSVELAPPGASEDEEGLAVPAAAAAAEEEEAPVEVAAAFEEAPPAPEPEAPPAPAPAPRAGRGPMYRTRASDLVLVNDE